MSKCLVIGAGGAGMSKSFKHEYFDWSDLAELYLGKELSQYVIARLKGCSQQGVSFALQRYGIRARTLGEARIGERNPFYGRHHTEETKRRIAIANTGKQNSLGIKLPQLQGENNPAKRPEVRAKISAHRKGISTGIGDKNVNWRGGASFEPYTKEYEQVRPLVLLRDNYLCQRCASSQNIGIHHKDHNKRNSALDNLITLCASCHAKLFHEERRAGKLWSV